MSKRGLPQRPKRRTRFRRIVLSLVAVGLVLTLSTCSPLYVVRAGWEEGKILWRKESIDELISQPDLDATLRAKLALVQKTRSFAIRSGLEAGGSFTEYSDVGRDVLLWVLSGSEKLAFRPVTWWFPIVGRIPYKGFFDKEDGLKAAERLKSENYDFYLRPSPAFSTLGWFDDPLLSTTIRFDEVALVNTVIHEILHNTVWIPNYATFNETLANVVGSVGAIEYFRSEYGPDHELTKLAQKRWNDELEFSAFLDRLIAELEAFYKGTLNADAAHSPQLLEKRDAILAKAADEWERAHPVQSERQRRRAQFNNATLLAYRIYLDRPQLFAALFEASGSQLTPFVTALRELDPALRRDSEGPFHALETHLAKIAPGAFPAVAADTKGAQSPKRAGPTDDAGSVVGNKPVDHNDHTDHESQ